MGITEKQIEKSVAIAKAYGVPVPTGNTWHMDLLKQFCEPLKLPLPCK